MSDVLTTPSIEDLIANSAAAAPFADALRELEARKRSTQYIKFSHSNPPVKVLRVLLALLEREPELPIESAHVDGVSGCSDYRGTITVNGGAKTYEFVWDCAWKAEQMGWTDFMGYPDQVRAARTLGYRCIRVLRETN